MHWRENRDEASLQNYLLSQKTIDTLRDRGSAPIQDDIDNDGSVNVFDPRTVAAYYDEHKTTCILKGDSTIDICDLVVIEANFGYFCNR